MNEPNKYMNPYLAGVLLGLVLLLSYFVLGAGLGASGGFARIGAELSSWVAPEHTHNSAYFGSWGMQPLKYYLLFMLIGTFLGVLFIGLLANGMTLMGVHPYWQEVARGLIVLFAELTSVWQKPIRK